MNMITKYEQGGKIHPLISAYEGSLLTAVRYPAKPSLWPRSMSGSRDGTRGTATSGVGTSAGFPIGACRSCVCLLGL